MPKKIKKEDLVDEKSDVEGLMSHLEDEYRKANVSEKHYRELKQKYSQKIAEIDKKLGVMGDDTKVLDAKTTKSVKKTGDDEKSEEIEEVDEKSNDGEIEEEKTDEPDVQKEDVKEEKKKGRGFLGKLFKKKEKKSEEETEETDGPNEEVAEEPTEDPKEEIIEGKTKISPLARKTAKELGIDYKSEKIIGTGPGGRISREDVVAYFKKREKAPEKKTAPAPACASKR